MTMGHWGQATLSPRRWARDVEGRRHWGQTTLRADDFEGRRLWGQATLRAGILYMKNICPQRRLPSKSRDVEGKYCCCRTNSCDLNNKNICPQRRATLRAGDVEGKFLNYYFLVVLWKHCQPKLFWKNHQNPTWQNCQNFQILDIWCQHYSVYTWKVFLHCG